jgi:uncharacterized protein (DUF983 family)
MSLRATPFLASPQTIAPQEGTRTGRSASRFGVAGVPLVSFPGEGATYQWDWLEGIVADNKSIWTGVKRGLARRCPNCGEGRLFSGYLTIRSPCEVCGLDNGIYPSDDFPPYLTILIVGHVLVPLFIWTDRAYAPPLWVQSAIWLPATVILCLSVLPFMKGATVGLCWGTNIVRPDSAT